MVSIEGDLTISSISSITSEIQNHLRLNSSLNIAINGINQMDITFLQLLFSLEGASHEVSIAMGPESREKIGEFIKSCGCRKELKMLNMEN